MELQFCECYKNNEYFEVGDLIYIENKGVLLFTSIDRSNNSGTFNIYSSLNDYEETIK